MDSDGRVKAGLRVLHVVRGLANSSGTTHIVIPLSEAEAELGCRVTVLHVQMPGRDFLVPDPARVESLCLPQTGGPGNPGFSLPFADILKRRIREFDVVHVHAVWNFPTWWTMRAAYLAGKPYIVAPQGSFDPWALNQSRWGKRMYSLLGERRYLQRADRLQALSQKEAIQFRAAGLTVPSVVIPNGISMSNIPEAAESLARTLGLPEGERTLLFLSRVHPKKGLDLLLRAFARMCEGRRITLVVAGSDGKSGYMEEIRNLARDLGIEGRCRFLGEVVGPEKFQVLKGADAFALISRSEGLPVAAIEALASGLPSVLSTECNLSETSQRDAFWEVPPEVDAAATALVDLFDSPWLAARRGVGGRKFVEQGYTWEVIARRTLAIYGEMLEERSPLSGKR